MKSLHLKDLPDEVRERLERLAQREHMSVSAFAVRELTELSRRADNPALLGDLPDSEVRVEDILADLMDDRESGRQAVVWPVPQNREIGIEDFSRDPHAAKYQGELQAHPDAFNRLFALLNDPANEQRLVDAEMLDLPALTGVVRFIEADFIIAHTLKSDQSVNRFSQTVGVAVRLKMEKLGWRKTGKKSTVRGSRYFTKAERYINETPSHICTALALEGLKTVSQIGDEHERAQTGRELMEALAAERRKEGRPF